MPTEYTRPIYEGEKDFTFEKFAMRCARNFNALSHLVDKPLDKEIDLEKDFLPPTFYKLMFEGAEEELQAFLDNPPTEEQLGREFEQEVKRRQECALAEVEKNTLMQERYAAMLEKAVEWQPPTPEHQGLKDFMIRQLKDSMDFDCALYMPEEMDREKYIQEHISPERLIRRVSYYREECEKEIRAYQRLKQWVKDLMDSLK